MNDRPHTPSVSVIMPVRNEQQFLSRSLRAVLDQDYPQNRMEVIVADGKSTDTTREIILDLQQHWPNLHVVDNPEKIVSTGLNVATAHAQGEIIIRVDGHCSINRDYVRRCVESLQKHKADGVGGPIETVGLTPISRVIALAMSSPFGVGGSSFRTVQTKTMAADTIPFPAYTRSVIHRAGKYDEELVRNQDDEYNYRLRKMGSKLILDTNIRSRYYCRSSLRTLCRQYFQYGFWKVRVMQKHVRQMRPRHFVPALFIVATVASLFLTSVASVFVWLLTLLIVAYLAANLSATVLLSSRYGRHKLAKLPIVFATMHLSYGFGFLCGLLWFLRRW